jgi:hypothetical protein
MTDTLTSTTPVTDGSIKQDVAFLGNLSRRLQHRDPTPPNFEDGAVLDGVIERLHNGYFDPAIRAAMRSIDSRMIPMPVRLSSPADDHISYVMLRRDESLPQVIERAGQHYIRVEPAPFGVPFYKTASNRVSVVD